MDMIVTAKTRDENQSPKQLRNQGWIPAVIYGPNFESQTSQLWYSDVQKFIQSNPSRFHLKFNNQTLMASLKEVQREPRTGKVWHLSFMAFSANDVVTLEVPVVLEGKAKGELDGGQLLQNITTLQVQGKISDLPEQLTVNIADLQLGDSLSVANCNWEGNFTVKGSLDRPVVTCQHKKVVSLEPNTEENAPEVATEATAEAAPEEKAA